MTPRPRRLIESLDAYHSPAEGRGALARLDFNENTTGFGDTGLPPELCDPSVYPEYGAFVADLAAAWGVSPERILLTNGSEEGLLVLAQCFVEPRVDVALTSRPTFALVPHFLRLCEARLREVPVTPGLAFDLAGLDAALCAEPVRLAIFATPDNPTGAVLPLPWIAAACARWPETLFVIDEAYAEYGGAPTALGLLDRHPNLVVVRTFSKAWGLAGLRLGVVVARPAIVGWLRAVRLPYSVNAAAVAVAHRMLPRADEVRRAAAETMRRKAELVAALARRGFGIHDGAAHFFLLDLGAQAAAFTAHCRALGVLVRDRSHLRETPGLVRISAGTAAEGQALLAAVDSFARATPPRAGCPSG